MPNVIKLGRYAICLVCIQKTKYLVNSNVKAEKITSFLMFFLCFKLF